jgi:CHASE3 domain sensor protein
VVLPSPLNDLWARIPLRRQGALVITVPVICLLLFLGASVYLRYYTVAAARYVTHTQAVLLESSSLLASLLSAETGVRGYGSTRNKSFLEPYELSMQKLPASVHRLKILVQDNPKQLQQVQVIEQKIQQELGLLSQSVNSTSTLVVGEDVFARQIPLLMQGKVVMDGLRLDINQFQREEQRLLKIREQWLDDQEQMRGWVQLFMTAISVFASVAAIFLFNRIERDRQLGLKKLQSQAQNVVQLNQILAQTNMMLADRNQELDQFVYVASHDLKAPLRAIANLSEWIEEDLEGQLPEEGDAQTSSADGCLN